MLTFSKCLGFEKRIRRKRPRNLCHAERRCVRFLCAPPFAAGVKEGSARCKSYPEETTAVYKLGTEGRPLVYSFWREGRRVQPPPGWCISFKEGKDDGISVFSD
ncbi:MAG: hypothetical protein Q8P67_05580 [archaeon]|nr:hypothetical protein [archaeon]